MGGGFHGAAVITLDAKGRVAIPTRHRDALLDGGKSLVVTAHPDGCVLIYPANEWEPVRLRVEAIEALAVRADGIYIDGTFGRGGHSRAILDRLGPQGRLVALDRDPQARAAARELRDGRFMFLKHNFGTLSAALDAAGVRSAHGMLFDLGISSPQLDDPARGFSFRADGPLDMRMDL